MLLSDLAQLAASTPPKPTPHKIAWDDLFFKIVPIAALTSAVLTPVMAVFTSQRQERGKQRAADLEKLRITALRFRSHLVHHGSRAAVRKRYDADFLPDLLIENFVEEVVNSALSQTARRQRAIRRAMVQLAGDMRVRMAEEIGLATAKFKDSDSRDDAEKRQDARLGWYEQNYAVNGLIDVSGTLGRLAATPDKQELQKTALKQTDILLSAVSIKRLGLRGRSPRPDAVSAPVPAQSAP